MPKLWTVTESSDPRPLGYGFECPGCGLNHAPYVRKPSNPSAQYRNDQHPVWKFNGDLDRPTFSPSLLVDVTVRGERIRCHSFIRDGRIQFLNDCTHKLKGQTVELPEVE